MRPDNEIEVLEGLEVIRLRPTMYVGPLSADTPVCLVEQALCVSLDHAASGSCTSIDIELEADGFIQVRDNGPGLAAWRNPSSGELQFKELEVLLACKLAKIHSSVGERYCTAGLAATNALAEELSIRSVMGGEAWTRDYRLGRPSSAVERRPSAGVLGTRMRFRLDSTILPTIRPDASQLAERLSKLQAEFPACRIQLLGS